jgi:GST-like protein
VIDLYTAPTPNGFKASIALEEMGLPYVVKRVNLRHGEQFAPEFLRISPSNKIPAIVDEGLSVFESGAILFYLAEKTGKLLPSSGPVRSRVLQWMFFQAAGTGPMLGQAHHFRNYSVEKIQYAIDRYTNEGKRLYHVVDRRLSESKYLAGDEYTIADIMNLPWLLLSKNQGIDIAEYPHVERWIADLKSRPGVTKGLTIPARDDTPMDARARENLFGSAQYQRR